MGSTQVSLVVLTVTEDRPPHIPKAVEAPVRRADRLAAGACNVLSWFCFAVAALTVWPLAARIAAALHGRPATGSPVVAVLVPLLWAVIGLGLRRVAKGVSSGRGGGTA